MSMDFTMNKYTRIAAFAACILSGSYAVASSSEAEEFNNKWLREVAAEFPDFAAAAGAAAAGGNTDGGSHLDNIETLLSDEFEGTIAALMESVSAMPPSTAGNASASASAAAAAAAAAVEDEKKFPFAISLCLLETRESVAHKLDIPVEEVKTPKPCDHDVPKPQSLIRAKLDNLTLFFDWQGDPFRSIVLVQKLNGNQSSFHHLPQEARPKIGFVPALTNCIHCRSEYKKPKLVQLRENKFGFGVIETDGISDENQQRLQAEVLGYLARIQ